jgi:hypothetical protein
MKASRGAQFVTSILIGTPPSEALLKIDIQVLVALEAMGSDRVSVTWSVRMGGQDGSPPAATMYICLL